MFYRFENGVIVGGPYNCDQSFPVTELADNHPDVIAFNNAIVDARAVADNGQAFVARQSQSKLDDIQRAIDVKDTDSALRSILSLLQEK